MAAVKQETGRTFPLQISEPARAELSRLEVNKENFLRILVIPGGCTGMTYQLGIDNVQTAFDRVLYEDQGLKVVTDKSSFPLLQGLYIDYSNDLVDYGFRFKNPNAVEACGCGGSFSV